jgi:hypothetical protein
VVGTRAGVSAGTVNLKGSCGGRRMRSPRVSLFLTPADPPAPGG